MNRRLTALVVLMFFCSGLTGLVLETVWVRLMVLVFGSTTFAVSTVLTAFMAGLALGSALAGRAGDRLASPRRALVIYALLEGGIGLYALAMPALAEALPALHGALWGRLHDSYHGFALLRFVLAAVILALPTMAMGATLPVLTRFLQSAAPDTSLGRTAGTLYAVNTFGGVAGVFLAGFILLPSLGSWTTNLLACLTDLLLAALALVLFLVTRDRAAQPAKTEGAASEPLAGKPTLAARLALASIAVSGAAAMALEVAWTRALSLVVGSSTYAFSIILMAFLVGLAGGAALYARRQASKPDQMGNLGVVHLLVALTGLVGLYGLDRLPVVFLGLLRRVELAPGPVFALKFVVAGLIVLLPTLFMGMVFPAVVRIWSHHGAGPARTTGAVYSVNTLGSIVGSFAGGFVLVPWLGVHHTLQAMLLVSLGLAMLLGALANSRLARFAIPSVAFLLALAMVVGHRPWKMELFTAGVFRVSRYQDFIGSKGDRPLAKSHDGAEPKGGQSVNKERAWFRAARQQIPGDRRVVDTFREAQVGYRVADHREGVTTAATITRTVDESISDHACWVRHTLLVNGKPDASLSVLHGRPKAGCGALLDDARAGRALRVSPSGDAETQVLSGLLSACAHSRFDQLKDALVIGWGSGMSAGALLRAPFREVVAVELEPEVVAAARQFEPHNLAPQNDRRLTLVNADGRNYLALSRRKFDVVVSEPSNPWISGCGNLFTREFFQQVRAHLRPQGVFVQWLQAYEMSPENVFSILASLAAVFPSVHVFSPARASSDLLLVARAEPGRIAWKSLATCLQHRPVAELLRWLSIQRPDDLAARLLAGPSGVKKVSAGAPQNTDDNARIEFAAPRDLINYRAYSSGEITRRLRRTLGPADRWFAQPPASVHEQLCLARLRAGRPPTDDDRNKCPVTYRNLEENIDHPVVMPDSVFAKQHFAGHPKLADVLAALARPPDQVAEALARVFDVEVGPSLRASVFCTLGKVQAARDLLYRGLTLMEAGARLAPGAAACRAVRLDRARTLFQLQLWPDAVRLGGIPTVP